MCEYQWFVRFQGYKVAGINPETSQTIEYCKGLKNFRISCFLKQLILSCKKPHGLHCRTRSQMVFDAWEHEIELMDGILFNVYDTLVAEGVDPEKV